MSMLLLVVILLVQVTTIVLVMYQSKRAPAIHTASAYELLEQIYDRVSGLLDAQRLSTILRLEPTSLKVSPDDFEVNKERLKSLLVKAYQTQDHPDPSTRAYCILNHSGFDSFVTPDTRAKTQTALARLLVNGKPKKIQTFLEEVVDMM